MDSKVPTPASVRPNTAMEPKPQKPEISVALVQRYLRTRAGKQSVGLAVTLGVSTVVTMSASSWGTGVAMGWSMVVAIVGTSFENYRRFFAMDLPARSPAALVAPSDPVVEELPAGLRPIARELTSILLALESIFEETFALFVSEESGSPMDEVNLHEFGAWLSRWDGLDEEALAVAHARGFRLDELRGLLSRQLALEPTAGDGMRLATGLAVAKAPPTDPERRWWQRGGSAARKAKHRALKSQVEHLRAVIVELRRLDDALYTGASQPYR